MTYFVKMFNLRALLLTSVIALGSTLSGVIPLPTEVKAQNNPTMTDDDLDLRRGVAWAAGSFAYNQVVNVVDSLTDKVLGRIVPDRHGTQGGIISEPFSNLKPGTSVFVSLWGVTLTGDRPPGCYVEYFVQVAPGNGGATLDAELLNALVPKSLEIRIGSRVIDIEPFREATKTRRAFNYQYSVIDYDTNRKYIYPAVWYMTRNLFRLTSSDVRILMNAPEGEVRTRLTFSDSGRIIVPIGGGTVAKWKEAYKLDPTCGEGTASEEPEISKKVAANSTEPPKKDNPTSTPSTPNIRVQGKVALAARQSVDSVTARLDGAYVTSGGTYEAKLLVENKSDRDFAFVPIFAKVVDGQGKEVSARVIIDNDSSGIARSGETTRARLVILGRKWNSSGRQNLFLIIKGNGDRNFRLPF
jgi:hypothetical protein